MAIDSKIYDNKTYESPSEGNDILSNSSDLGDYVSSLAAKGKEFLDTGLDYGSDAGNVADKMKKNSNFALIELLVSCNGCTLSIIEIWYLENGKR